jgi:hypothetical protein
LEVAVVVIAGVGVEVVVDLNQFPIFATLAKLKQTLFPTNLEASIMIK